jgi:ABC-type phosphate transport system auxiliary subunit
MEKIEFERKRRELRKTIDEMNKLVIEMEYLKHQDFDKYLQAFKRYMLLDGKRKQLLDDLIKKSATVSANGGSAEQSTRSPFVVFMVWGYVECKVDVLIG